MRKSDVICDGWKGGSELLSNSLDVVVCSATDVPAVVAVVVEVVR